MASSPTAAKFLAWRRAHKREPDAYEMLTREPTDIGPILIGARSETLASNERLSKLDRFAIGRPSALSKRAPMVRCLK